MTNDEVSGRLQRMDAATLRPGRDAEIMPPRSTDDEASAILDELSKLQTLLTLQMHEGPVWISAAGLVQRTRVLIIERCKRKPVYDHSTG
jgi:hypothetical protein